MNSIIKLTVFIIIILSNANATNSSKNIKKIHCNYIDEFTLSSKHKVCYYHCGKKEKEIIIPHEKKCPKTKEIYDTYNFEN